MGKAEYFNAHSGRNVTVYMVARETARLWADGMPDEFLLSRLWHEGPVACVFGLNSKWGFREVRRIFATSRDLCGHTVQAMTAWTGHPLLLRRYEGFGGEITFTEPRGKRFWFEGDSLQEVLRRLRV